MGLLPLPKTPLLKISKLFDNQSFIKNITIILKIIEKFTKDFLGFVMYKYENIKIRYYDNKKIHQHSKNRH